MLLIRPAAVALLLLASLTSWANEPATSDLLEKNKATVVAFYNTALNNKDAETAIALMGDSYTQHNSGIADGKDGFRQFIAGFKQAYPQSHSEIVRVLAEGDYVVLHVHMVTEPGTRGQAVMDIFRLDNGKIVEHWDVLQAIPDTMPHHNGMF